MASDGFKAGFIVTFVISLIAYGWIYYTHVPTEVYIRTVFNFTIISDMDQQSRIKSEPSWQSILKNGTLFFNKTTDKYTIKITNSIQIQSHYSRKLRGMELSELILFQNELLSFCDSSGIIYKINATSGEALPKHLVISDENKPDAFKMEWATKYGQELYIGSIGKEWVVDGVTKHYIPNLIKIIDKHGKISTKNWTSVYEKVRKESNTTFPGYLQHEAVIWDNDIKRWLFAPRKASETIPYDEISDETQGSNLLIQMNSWERVTNVSRFGPLEKDYGFSSFKKIPKTNHHYVVLKTKEVSKPEKIIRSKIGVIDLDGNMKSDWYDLGDIKYEGIEIMSFK
eukprot:gene8310-134_t